MIKVSKKLFLKIIILATSIIILILLGLFLYIKFFFSFADKNIQTLMSYEYLSNQYYQHKNTFACIENIKPGYRIYFLNFEKKSFFTPEKIKINNKYYELDSKKTNPIKEIATQENIREDDLSCLLKIIKNIPPFFGNSIDKSTITFYGSGSYFDSEYGLKYFFDEKEGVNSEKKSSLDQKIIIFSQKKIEKNWFTFYES